MRSFSWTDVHGSENASLQQRRLFQVTANSLSSSTVPEASGEGDMSPLRGLRMAFYNRLDSTR